MSAVDRATFAERAAVLERHLVRVQDRLPVDAADMQPMSDTSDAVVLHLWQAVQVVIDIATSVCVSRGLGVPPTYADAFRLLAGDGVLPENLSRRLVQAAGFRNLVVHAYADLDLQRVYAAAAAGPDDLRAFLKAIRDIIEK